MTKQNKKILLLFSQSIFLVLFFLTDVSTAFSSLLKDIRYSTSSEGFRMVFDLSEATTFHESFMADGQTFHLTLVDCQPSYDHSASLLKNKWLKDIRVHSPTISEVKIEITLAKPMKTYHVFPLKPIQDKPHRIVLDFFLNEKSANGSKKKTEALGKSTESAKIKKAILVIDPGHGGEDPGAIGYQGLKEKDIVLRIAKELKAVIEKSNPTIQVILTRDGDYFIPLQERVKIAHKHEADLFVSLHINASKKKYIEGTSVYYISETGATDKAADLLAARENSSDLMGGISLSNNALLNTILIDLIQNYTINESIKICHLLLPGLVKTGFHNEGIKCANFVVLKSPTIPSVLLEIGYITNKKDAQRIAQKKNQKQVAENLGKSIAGFLTIEHNNNRKAPGG